MSEEPHNNLLYAAIQAAAGGYAGMSATERSLGDGRVGSKAALWMGCGL